MIETRPLKNVVIFIQTILSFVLSRNTIKLELSWNIVNIKNIERHFPTQDTFSYFFDNSFQV